MTVTARAAPPPNVRPVRTTDLLSVYRLERRCFDHPWPFSAFESHVDAPGFLVATVDGRLAGYVVGSVEDSFPGPRGHIKDLAVHPDYRRRGIARRLLSESLRRLRAEGAIGAMLEVRPSNESAIALYRTVGFEAMRIREHYYQDGEAALVMSRSLRRSIDIG